MAKVWFCIRDYGSQGLQEPVRAFGRKELADAYHLGATEAGFGMVRVFELEVEGIDTAIQEAEAK